MGEDYVPILGELAGRSVVPLTDVPAGMRAVTVPVKRDGETRVPRDRRGRIKPVRVDLVAATQPALFEPPDSLSKADLIWVLSKNSRRWGSVARRFGNRSGEVAAGLVRQGGIVLRCAVDRDQLRLGSPEGWSLSRAWREQSADVLAELRPRRDPDEVRKELMRLLDGVEGPATLVAERELLRAVPAGSPLTVPAGTFTAAKSWVTYEASLLAAAAWVALDHVPDLTELAGLAWGDTHITWSTARSIVFSQLIEQDFATAVKRADIDIRMRGPLIWRQGSAIADARRAHPWIGLPRDGMRLAGELEYSGVGVLLVENAASFQEVCADPQISGKWLCIWGKGKAIVTAAELINALQVTRVVTWLDLDAAGLEIFAMLAERVSCEVIPVGMDFELWEAGRPRTRRIPEENDKAIREDKALAAKLIERLPASLREVAVGIMQTGKSVEQQTLHQQILPVLPGILEGLSAT
ncbi:Wadjet anti-phage system protein JetD domain-containing protein [Amycolatopsis dongchuanensis]|uniref:Wadjet protein JetD C-terminal domain-containing protein n=1 Tax=Amycolatopsis dongchuanensis TaxID=1070866 RepID=A0ABP9Q426_9PSEU